MLKLHPLFQGNFITVIDIKKFLGISESDTESQSKPDLNLQGRLGLPAQQNETDNTLIATRYEQLNSSKNKNNIIVVEFAEYIVGFLVDEIFRIVEIPEEQIKLTDINSDKYILSEAIVDDKVFNILNIESIFSDERFFVEES